MPDVITPELILTLNFKAYSPTSRSSYQWIQDTSGQSQVACRILLPHIYKGIHNMRMAAAMPAIVPYAIWYPEVFIQGLV